MSVDRIQSNYSIHLIKLYCQIKVEIAHLINDFKFLITVYLLSFFDTNVSDSGIVDMNSMNSSEKCFFFLYESNGMYPSGNWIFMSIFG